MTELSPAAQAVRDAAFEPWQSTDTPESIAAAVLRAAADQVVPVENTKAKMFEWQRDRLEQRTITRQALIAIANELES